MASSAGFQPGKGAATATRCDNCHRLDEAKGPSPGEEDGYATLGGKRRCRMLRILHGSRSRPALDQNGIGKLREKLFFSSPPPGIFYGNVSVPPIVPDSPRSPGLSS